MEDADNLPINSWTQFGQAGDNLFNRESLLQRVQSLQIFPHKLFIDHGNPHAGFAVMVSERAAAHNTNAKRFEVVRGDRLEGRTRPLSEIDPPAHRQGKMAFRRWCRATGPR